VGKIESTDLGIGASGGVVERIECAGFGIEGTAVEFIMRNESMGCRIEATAVEFVGRNEPTGSGIESAKLAAEQPLE
jgi:hypothetical protein